MHPEEYNRCAHVLLDMGEALLCCGAEVHRVEDALTRIAQSYGAKRIHVFVITACIVLTLEFSDGTEATQSRRILAWDTHFKKLDALNTLSRSFCHGAMTLDQLANRIEQTMQQPDSIEAQYLGSVITSVSYCLFFGGTAADAFVSGVAALVVCWMQLHIAPFCMTRMVFNFLAAFVTGLFICLIARAGGQLHADSIMIGDIMLLIPGVAMTNAVRDMMLGDTIAGVMRLAEAVLWTGTLAAGFVAAMLMTGGMV